MALATRLDWAVIEAVASGRRGRPAVTSPPVPTEATPAPLSPKGPDLLGSLPADPRVRLWTLLTSWTSTSDADITEGQVLAMYHEILRLMDLPGGDSWYRAWRLAHPDIRMGAILR